MSETERRDYLLLKAKERLLGGTYTVVLEDGKVTITSNERGVKPLLELFDSGRDYSEFAAADKVVGKAAAMIYSLLGVKAIYADVLSEKAQKFLIGAGIYSEYGTLTPKIINRKGDGPCPMESAVENIDDPYEAYLAIKEKLKEIT